MLAKVRHFFALRNVVEVDCPILGRAAPIDEQIDVLSLTLPHGEKRFLHTSAEYGMKRLLALGMPDIYQMSHVFRLGESGPLHNPEFTMVEWYRKEFELAALIEETAQFMRLFLGDLAVKTLSFREAFAQATGCDYAHPPREALPPESADWSRETCLDYLMSFVVEPTLGHDHLCVLTDFPASCAALAKLQHKDGECVAMRFEIYHQGIELANGYDELTDAEEQKKRLDRALQARMALGKEALPVDEAFLDALQQGLPPCCGVAVGFDRLMLLRHSLHSLEQVLPFDWQRA